MRRFHTSRRLHDARAALPPVTIPYYEPEDYHLIRTRMLSEPRSALPGRLPILPPDYQQWLEITSHQERGCKRRGLLVVRITIEATAFFDWCEARSFPVNIDSAERFAYEKERGPERLARDRQFRELLKRAPAGYSFRDTAHVSPTAKLWPDKSPRARKRALEREARRAKRAHG